jgi:DNA-binding transcriptional MocR family regulator
MSLYHQLADDVAQQIAAGTLRPGDRLPSVRRLCATRHVSASTVLHAYHLLEDRGLIVTRPRSGYFVSDRPPGPPAAPQVAEPAERPTHVAVTDLLFDYLEALRDRSHVQLGTAFPSPLLYPLSKLGQTVAATARKMDPWRTVEDLPPGNRDLRRYIARRYLEVGAEVDVEEIVITSGASEAMLVCLLTATRAGDVVAVEAPMFYAVLQACEAAGLDAIEIPVDPVTGMDLDALERAIARHPVKLCCAMPNFQNPTGALMPIERKQRLVSLLAKHGIPLLEDDAYAELYFGARKPPPAKAYDAHGLVMHCGSFSKALAPGYRVGWAAAGRYAREVRRNKFLFSIETNVIAQDAIAEYVRHGGYEHHLRGLRTALREQLAEMLRAIGRYFPPEVKVSRPEGGYFVWMQLPPGVGAMELHRRSLAEGICISPGPLFSPNGGFGGYIRLNFGHPWSQRMDRGLATVGRLASTLRDEGRERAAAERARAG